MATEYRHGHSDRQTKRKTERKEGRQEDRQKERKTGSQTERKTEIDRDGRKTELSGRSRRRIFHSPGAKA